MRGGKKKEPKISVIVLVYNREDVIEKIVRDFYSKVISRLPGSELVIAEDGSTDGTKEILARLDRELERMRLVQGNERKGYIQACIDGITSAPDADYVFLSDGDGEHKPADFWRLYKRRGRCDIVTGYKMNRKPYYRMLISRFNNALLGLFFGVCLRDANCGFKLISQDVIKAVAHDLGQLRWAINAELIIRAKHKGFSYCEVGVRHHPAESEVFPIRNMPKVIVRQITDMIKLKKELMCG
jgi:glycosyltransferase involved in cell wall biosynthesis